MTRQEALHHADRPLLKGFLENRVVRVARRTAREVPRLVPAQAFLVEEDAHEFGDDKRRVCVVEVDEHLVRQFVPARVRLEVAAQDVAHRAADEEVLLAEAKLLAGDRVVVRIEDLREVLGEHLRLDGLDVRALVEVLEVKLVDGLRAPETERVHGVTVADDRNVVRHALDRLGRHPDPLLASALGEALDMAAEVHVLRVLHALHLPRIAVLEPAVRFLDLVAVDDLLTENAVVVADAVAHAREVQRRHRVDVARRETAEAAVAEARVGLAIAEVVPVDAVFRERVVAELVGLEVDHVVAEESPDEKLKGHVVDTLRVLLRVLFLRGDPALDDAVADGVRERSVLVELGGTAVALDQGIAEMPGEVLLEAFDGHFNAAVFLLRHCLCFFLVCSKLT